MASVHSLTFSFMSAKWSTGDLSGLPRIPRYFPSTFGGMGLHSLPVEATVCSINLFLQHYGSESNLGLTIKASLQELQMELGVTGNPLEYDFDVWGVLAEDTWVKHLWERLWYYQIRLDMEYGGRMHRAGSRDKPYLPRENDKCVMEALVAKGVRGKTLAQANRCRIRNEIFWYSCIATADGIGVDPSYLSDWKGSHEGTLGNHRSHLQFGDACPVEADWCAWKSALQELLAGNWRFATGLGRYTGRSPRVW